MHEHHRRTQQQGEFLSTNYDRGSFDIVYVADKPIESNNAENKSAESEG